MDTQELRAFIAVADNGSFSRAAERLYLTQPAVSKRIAALEERLEQRLFDRINRRASLTESGRRLLPRARQIIAMVEETRHALTESATDLTGSLRLATSHHVGLHRLPPVLKRFATLHPQVQIDLTFLDSEQAYQGVIEGDIEMAVVTLSPQVFQQLHVQTVWIDHLRYVCGNDHPLAVMPHVSLETLAEHEAVLPDPHTFTRGIVARHFSEQGLVPRIAMSTNYLETLKMLTSIGLGWSLLPDTVLDDSVHLLPINSPLPKRPLGYLFHKGRTLSKATLRMKELLDEAYALDRNDMLNNRV